MRCVKNSTQPGGLNRTAASRVSETRALVPLSPIIEASERTAAHHHVPFLAQLVATKDQHPQTRQRRRAEPDVALAAYRATVALTAF